MALFKNQQEKQQQEQAQQDQEQQQQPAPPQSPKDVELPEGEESPEQAAGTVPDEQGFPVKKSADDVQEEAEQIRKLSDKSQTDDALDPGVATSAADSGSSPNSPSSIAAKMPQAPRDAQGRFKRAVPDASGVSINGRPAHESEPNAAVRTQPQVYQNDDQSAQVGEVEADDELSLRRQGKLSETNKLVDNAPEVAKPQQVKDEQARNASARDMKAS